MCRAPTDTPQSLTGVDEEGSPGLLRETSSKTEEAKTEKEKKKPTWKNQTLQGEETFTQLLLVISEDKGRLRGCEVRMRHYLKVIFKKPK